ncbi:MAG TPA: SGNH/GDSL hydrolase family protein [Lachnospiraceae bacterium]|nr:SGNH/GDSL hydrolase family protein [Lachnospiraceae bacterium]
MNFIIKWYFDLKTKHLRGNGKEYGPENTEPLAESPLSGKNIAFLGSSVTFGAASGGVSFVEYLAKRNRFTFVKEAVSGTCLVDDSEDSYISRMKRMDKNQKFDLFICQLSTNDATANKAPGSVSKSRSREDFDTKTIDGAEEYIISYAKETWNCPVMFYTNCFFDSRPYRLMIGQLMILRKKWNIGIIDLYTDEEFNNITQEERALYMRDPIHPTKAGYLKWWLPKIEEQIYSYIV